MKTPSPRAKPRGRRARTTASSTRPSLKRRAWHRSPQNARKRRPSSVDGAPPLRTWRQASVESDAPIVIESPAQSQRGGRRSLPAKARSTVAQTRRPTACGIVNPRILASSSSFASAAAYASSPPTRGTFTERSYCLFLGANSNEKAPGGASRRIASRARFAQSESSAAAASDKDAAKLMSPSTRDGRGHAASADDAPRSVTWEELHSLPARNFSESRNNDRVASIRSGGLTEEAQW